MKRETDVLNDKERFQEEQAFKNLVYGHSVAGHLPNLYFKLFSEGESTLTPEQEEELEWTRPENENDVEAMMSELRNTGWSG
jgi:hypothetical protein